jgi:hypothetical protein
VLDKKILSRNFRRSKEEYMSYAIIRNEKLTRAQAMGAYKHNERKTKNHSNKNIDSNKTKLNYYLKKTELSYIKEFDRIKDKYDLKGQIRSNSNIMCEMVFTSDQKFFDEIGYEESKRYFEESYKFICDYKSLGEQNIISAVVHIDEDTPHMHLLFIPVVHTTDKDGNKIENEIIKPRDELIQELHKENISLRKELLKQSNTVEMATEYEKKHTQMLEDNVNLKFKCQTLEKSLKKQKQELNQQFEDEIYKMDYQYQKIINKLEKENNYLKKVVDRFKVTVQKFITWICHKFSYPSEDELIRKFEEETYTNFNIENQLDINKFEKKEKEDELELY